MNLLESLRTSLAGIAMNKMRSALTMLGIIVGVAAVVALSSLGQGVSQSVTEQIESVGANMIMIQPYTSSDAARRSVLTMDDYEALTDRTTTPALEMVAPQASANLAISRDGEGSTYSVVGTNQHLDDISALELEMGGFLTGADDEDRAKVAVLGWDVYDELFADGEYPIQQRIKIEGAQFTVVGVLAEDSGILSSNSDVYVPINTAHARLLTERTLAGEYTINSIMASAVSQEASDAAQAQVEAILCERHDIADGEDDDFRVNTQESILEVANEVTGTLTVFLSAIAAISLVVGGIGIMNIMLVTVTERTREIGIRKAIGAPEIAIMSQFVIEATILCMLGGILGIALGGLASRVVAPVLGVTPAILPQTVALAFGVSVAVGLVFGTYPALKAARLEPIEALRYE